MPPSARAQPRTYYRRAGSAFWGWHPVSTRPKRGPSIKEKKMSDAGNTLVLTLDSGDVTINLRPDLAPGHVARIKELTREGFSDGVAFPRVINGFMALGGVPTGPAMGGSQKPDLNAHFYAEPHVHGIR